MPLNSYKTYKEAKKHNNTNVYENINDILKTLIDGYATKTFLESYYVVDKLFNDKKINCYITYNEANNFIIIEKINSKTCILNKLLDQSVAGTKLIYYEFNDDKFLLRKMLTSYSIIRVGAELYYVSDSNKEISFIETETLNKIKTTRNGIEKFNL